jgi:glycosyltransferase involved in cell wall biosynthesis
MKITIITVVLNGEDHLEHCLRSCAKQTYRNIEHIVVDGGSRDRSVEIIKRYEHRIYSWSSENDRGIYDAMNKGMARCSGEWVIFVNADDAFSDVDAVARIADACGTADPSVGIIYFPMNIIGKDNEQIKTVRPSMTIALRDLRSRLSIPHQAQCVRVEALRRAGFFNIHYQIAADYAATLEILKHWSLNFAEMEPPVSMRLGGISSDRRFARRMLEEYMRIQRSNRYNPYCWHNIASLASIELERRSPRLHRYARIIWRALRQK